MEKLKAFMSYTRFDDENDGKRLTLLCKRLSDEVRAQTGKKFPIFQDIEDIRWGQDFKERIENALKDATFFIPIITPSFFESKYCREELEQFLKREEQLQRNDLILAVYYIRCPILEDRSKRATDKLAQTIAARQYVDWRDLRFEDFNSPEVRSKLVDMARQLAAAMERQAEVPTDEEPPPEAVAMPEEGPEWVPLQSPRWRRWVLAGLVIIPLLIASGMGYYFYQQAQPPATVMSPTETPVPPTPTPMASLAPTDTPTTTNTPSPIVALTSTATDTPSPSATLTSTATNTSSPSATPSPTPTATEMPTQTPAPPTATAAQTLTPPTSTVVPTAVPQPVGSIALAIYLRGTLTETGFAALSSDQPNEGMIYEEGKCIYGDASVQIGHTVYHFDKPEVGPGEPEQLPDPWRVEFEFAEVLLEHTENKADCAVNGAGFDPKKAWFWVGTLDSDSAIGEEDPYSLTMKLYKGNELRESVQVFFTVADAPPSGGGEDGPGGKPQMP